MIGRGLYLSLALTIFIGIVQATSLLDYYEAFTVSNLDGRPKVARPWEGVQLICPSEDGVFENTEDCFNFFSYLCKLIGGSNCSEEYNKKCLSAINSICEERDQVTTDLPFTTRSEPTTINEITTPEETTVPSTTTTPEPTTTTTPEPTTTTTPEPTTTTTPEPTTTTTPEPTTTTTPEPTTTRTAKPTTQKPTKPTGPPETTCPENDLDCIVDDTGVTPDWFICPEDIGSYPHPLSNKLFIFCINWKPSVKRCGKNLVYSVKMRTCINPGA